MTQTEWRWLLRVVGWVTVAFVGFWIIAKIPVLTLVALVTILLAIPYFGSRLEPEHNLRGLLALLTYGLTTALFLFLLVGKVVILEHTHYGHGQIVYHHDSFLGSLVLWELLGSTISLILWFRIVRPLGTRILDGAYFRTRRETWVAIALSLVSLIIGGSLLQPRMEMKRYYDHETYLLGHTNLTSVEVTTDRRTLLVNYRDCALYDSEPAIEVGFYLALEQNGPNCKEPKAPTTLLYQRSYTPKIPKCSQGDDSISLRIDIPQPVAATNPSEWEWFLVFQQDLTNWPGFEGIETTFLHKPCGSTDIQKLVAKNYNLITGRVSKKFESSGLQLVTHEQ